MSKLTRRRTVAAVCTAAVVATAVVALAAAKPKAGNWSGLTNRLNPVTFTVSSNRKAVTKFATHLGYDGRCIFSGGAGGFSYYTVNVSKMTITAHNTFSARVTVTSPIIKSTAKAVISGKFVGSAAEGTVSIPTRYCPAPRKTTHEYSESFSATRIVKLTSLLHP